MIVHPVVLVSSSSILFMPESSTLIKAMDDAIRSDLQSFSDSFFWLALVCSAIVVIGVAFEGPELLYELWPETFSVFAARWVKKIGLIGWLLVVVGVGGEVIFGLLENKAEGLLQTFNNILLADAQRQSSDANERAASAFERAAITEREASQENARAAKAEQQASEENVHAAEALKAAEVARKNAEGFSLQIAQANERAANAEARTSETEVELARIKSPRSLTNIPKLIAALEPFKGTEYTFTTVFQDEESLYLLRAIHEALQEAGWKRDKSPGGFPAINIYGTQVPDFAVPIGFGTGIQVSVDSAESLASLQSHKINDLPPLIRAAVALNLGLSSSLSPALAPVDNKLVDVQLGTSPIIRIAVGKKP